LLQQKGKIESVLTPIGDLEIHSFVSTNVKNSNFETNLPIILIHGLCISNRYMIPAMTELAKYARIYAPSLPGSGESKKPPRALNVEELSNVLAEWMKTIGIKRAVFVGHSFGTQVITDFSLRYPEMVERAVLAAPTLNRRERTFLRQLLRFLQDAFYEPFTLMYIAIFDYLNFGFLRAIKTIRYAFENKIEDNLPRVKVPTLVIRGEYDTVVPQNWAEEVTNLLPDGKLVTIARETHGFNYNSPEQFAEAIRRFLDY
jgi:pimeloyl-ACP methyl ester carboxylesterase